jgi:hypothetical protein
MGQPVLIIGEIAPDGSVTSRSWSKSQDEIDRIAAALGTPHISAAVNTSGGIKTRMHTTCEEAHGPEPCPVAQPLAMTAKDVFDRILSAADPLERAKRAHHAVTTTLGFLGHIAMLRAQAILEAKTPDRSWAWIARQLGVSPQRISQLSKPAKKKTD